MRPGRHKCRPYNGTARRGRIHAPLGSGDVRGQGGINAAPAKIFRRGRIHAPLGSGDARGQGGINAALQKYSVGGVFMRPWVQVMYAARAA